MTLPGYHDTMDISSQTSRFIAAHRNQDVRDLALSAKRVDGLDLPFALDQIAGWQTACRKLPQWAETDGIVYPPHISMEQCSSQFAAQYKAGIARRVAGAGGAMVDLRIRRRLLVYRAWIQPGGLCGAPASPVRARGS